MSICPQENQNVCLLIKLSSTLALSLSLLLTVQRVRMAVWSPFISFVYVLNLCFHPVSAALLSMYYHSQNRMCSPSLFCSCPRAGAFQNRHCSCVSPLTPPTSKVNQDSWQRPYFTASTTTTTNSVSASRCKRNANRTLRRILHHTPYYPEKHNNTST